MKRTSDTESASPTKVARISDPLADEREWPQVTTEQLDEARRSAAPMRLYDVEELVYMSVVAPARLVAALDTWPGSQDSVLSKFFGGYIEHVCTGNKDHFTRVNSMRCFNRCKHEQKAVQWLAKCLASDDLLSSAITSPPGI